MGDGPPGGGVMRYHKRPNAFRPVGPRGKALAAILEGRVTDGVLTLDADTDGHTAALDRPRQHCPYHGRVARYDEIGLYYRFYIKGIPFERKCKGFVGTCGPVLVNLGGRQLRIAAWGARWP